MYSPARPNVKGALPQTFTQTTPQPPLCFELYILVHPLSVIKLTTVLITQIVSFLNITQFGIGGLN